MDDLKIFALELMESNSEDEVIAILKKRGYWDDKTCWRDYGDVPNNNGIIMNQSDKAEYSLVEKLTNSIDAVIMSECLIEYGDLSKCEELKSPSEAVQKVILKQEHNLSSSNPLENVDDKTLDELSQRIQLVVTGDKAPKNPCFTIVDLGEGQNPEKLPKTILSLGETNKIKYRFVHGAFNQGGSGALRFCGKNGIQFVMSKRNPNLKNDSCDSQNEWGFTVVRRERPTGDRKMSSFRYLAPLDAKKKENKGKILTFKANAMPILPGGTTSKPMPYVKECKWGTVIKMYNYNIGSYKSQANIDNAIGQRLNVILPTPNYPYRIVDCRQFGSTGSQNMDYSGLSRYLQTTGNNRLEEGFSFPPTAQVVISKERAKLTIYAFKRGLMKTYLRRTGIVFSQNGQSQYEEDKRFFSRKSVGLDYLKDDLFVIVDCTDFSQSAKEDVFMANRTQMAATEFRDKLENEIIRVLKNQSELSRLKEKRRMDLINEKVKDDKPFLDAMKAVFKTNPTLASLLSGKGNIATPYTIKNVGEQQSCFIGKQYPTFVRFKKMKYGKIKSQNAHVGQKSRIFFETDVENRYFNRPVGQGEFNLFLVEEKNESEYGDYAINLFNGIISLTLDLPEGASVGENYCFKAVVTDYTNVEEWFNFFDLKVEKSSADEKSTKGVRVKSPSSAEGEKRGENQYAGIPEPNLITKEKWEYYEGINAESAVWLLGDADNGFDYFINIDNKYLHLSYKENKLESVDLLKKQYVWGQFLLALAIVNKCKNMYENNTDNDMLSIDVLVRRITEAWAPFIIPTIDLLGKLNEENVISSD